MGGDTHWQDIQEKVFTRWCTDYLADRGMACDNLKEDLKDGLLLINLLEILSSKSLGRYNKHPRVIYQKLENLNIALAFIKSEGIRLENIGAEDINGGNLRIILGLIWTLILRFEINNGAGEGDDAGSNALLEWVRSKIPEYDIKNFKNNWNDGRAVCALTNAMKPGLIPDHFSKDPGNGVANCKEGIDMAEKALGVDPLILPDEMNNKKVDKLAVMTYVAQFRNIKQIEKPHDATRCRAYGPGLVEGIQNEEAPFTVQVPEDAEGKLEIKVEGPEDSAKVTVTKKNGLYDVVYLPTTPGVYKVHVTLGGEHIQGSIFHVTVMEDVSLGGEGKIRIFYTTTTSNEKVRHDCRQLDTLLQGKKVHLRDNFEQKYALDIMDKADRDAIYKKAGTRVIPVVFVNDKYVGGYDELMKLEENGELDAVLMMKGAHLISEEQHLARLKNMDPSKAAGPEEPAAEQKQEAPSAPAGKNFCPACGSPHNEAKFCPSCGHKF